MEPQFRALEGRFLTTGPPWKSPGRVFLFGVFKAFFFFFFWLHLTFCGNLNSLTRDQNQTLGVESVES